MKAGMNSRRAGTLQDCRRPLTSELQLPGRLHEKVGNGSCGQTAHGFCKGA